MFSSVASSGASTSSKTVLGPGDKNILTMDPNQVNIKIGDRNLIQIRIMFNRVGVLIMILTKITLEFF